MTKIRMSDNSMEPKIERGDIVVINNDEKETIDGKYYLIRAGKDVMIRKVWKREKGYYCEPANTSKCFASLLPYNSDVKILGRVIRIEREV